MVAVVKLWECIGLFHTQQLPYFIFPLSTQESSLSSMSSAMPLRFIVAVLKHVKWRLWLCLVSPSWLSLLPRVSQPFVYLLWRNFYSGPWPAFELFPLRFVDWQQSFKSNLEQWNRMQRGPLSLHDADPLADTSPAHHLFHSVGCHFPALIVSAEVQQFKVLIINVFFICLLFLKKCHSQ